MGVVVVVVVDVVVVVVVVVVEFSTAEQSEGHPVCEPMSVHVQVQVQSTG